MATKRLNFHPVMTALQESGDQTRLFQWADKNIKSYPELAGLHANVNLGGKEYHKVKILSLQGYTDQLPSICLPVSRGGYGAMYLELHVEPGRLSKHRLNWRDYLVKMGNYHVECREWKHAVEEILAYLAGNKVKGK